MKRSVTGWCQNIYVFLLLSLLRLQASLCGAVGRALTQEPEVPGSIPSPATYFLISLR